MTPTVRPVGKYIAKEWRQFVAEAKHSLEIQNLGKRRP